MAVLKTYYLSMNPKGVLHTFENHFDISTNNPANSGKFLILDGTAKGSTILSSSVLSFNLLVSPILNSPGFTVALDPNIIPNKNTQLSNHNYSFGRGVVFKTLKPFSTSKFGWLAPTAVLSNTILRVFQLPHRYSDQFVLIFAGLIYPNMLEIKERKFWAQRTSM